MAKKITQIYTLIDEASKTLDDIEAGWEGVDRAQKEHIETQKKATQTEKAANKEHQKTAETLRTVKQATVIRDKQLKSSENAYKRLVARYDEAARLTQRLEAAQKVLNRALKTGAITQKEYEVSLRNVTKGIQDQTLASGRNAAAQLSLTKIWERAKFILKTFIAAMAIRAIYAFTTGILDATLAMEKMEATLRASTGSQAGAAAGLEFAKQTAKELGLEYKNLATQYSKFLASTRGTDLQEQSEMIFKGFSKAATALRLSSAETEGIFRALTQMISKGTVQAEELRGQLGERLPGALRIAADAMGVTTAALGKMMEQGLLVAEDLLPAMAKALDDIYGLEARRAAESMQASVNNLSNAWFDFMQVLANSPAGDTMKGGLDLAADTLTWLGDAITAIGWAWDSFQVGAGFSIRKIDDLNNTKLYKVTGEIYRVDQAIQELTNTMRSDSEMSEQRRLEMNEMLTLYSIYRSELEATYLAMTQLAEITEAFSVRQTKAANAFGALLDNINPLTKALNTYSEGLRVVNEYMSTNEYDTDQVVAAVTRLAEIYNKAKSSALGLAKGERTAAAARREAAMEARKAQREAEKAEAAATKRREAMERSDLGLKKQKAINKEWRQGARNLMELNKQYAMAEAERVAKVGARKMDMVPLEETRFVNQAVQTERLKQENKYLEEQRKSYDALATDAEKYLIAEEEIYRLHTEGSPAAIEAVKQLNIQYAHLLTTSEQVNLGISEGFESVAKSANNIFDNIQQTVEKAFQGMEDSLVDFVDTGKFEFTDLVNSILKDILRMSIQKGITGPLSTALGTAFASATGGNTSPSLGGGGGTSPDMMFGQAAPALMSYREGGSFRVGGVGATDSQLVAFRAAPGERVTIDPATGANAAGAAGGGGGQVVNIYNSASGTETRTESRTGANGMQELDVYIENVVARSVQDNGRVGTAIDSTRATKRRSIQR